MRQLADPQRMSWSIAPVLPSASPPDFPIRGLARPWAEVESRVQCAGAVVSPGDWIVSDEDGVVVVPRDRLEATIGAAGRLLKVEIKIQPEIERGKYLAALLNYDEMIASKAATGGLPQMRFSRK